MAKTRKFTDLQLILLSTAAARDDGNVFPLKHCINDNTAEVAKAPRCSSTRSWSNNLRSSWSASGAKTAISGSASPSPKRAAA